MLVHFVKFTAKFYLETFNSINCFTMKVVYTTPVTNIRVVRLDASLLTVSTPGGAQTQGFTSAGTYTDDDWDIE